MAAGAWHRHPLIVAPFLGKKCVLRLLTASHTSQMSRCLRTYVGPTRGRGLLLPRRGPRPAPGGVQCQPRPARTVEESPWSHGCHARPYGSVSPANARGPASSRGPCRHQRADATSSTTTCRRHASSARRPGPGRAACRGAPARRHVRTEFGAFPSSIQKGVCSASSRRRYPPVAGQGAAERRGRDHG
jgi:hypothetical protein